ncbi:MAG: amidohydrolase [Eudoraea sp.]|nr:amidohydrolase [Eudoraea sp.]
MPIELSVALIQTSLVWQDPAKNREVFTNAIKTLAAPVDLMVLPEMFTTGFTMTPEAIDQNEGPLTLAWMISQAKEHNMALVGSVPFFEEAHYTNRLFFVEPNGQYHYYDKKHTFTLAGEDAVYKSGEKRLIVDYRGFKICPMICYDLRFPVWARYKGDYDVLLYVANWPQPRVSAWDTLLKARAVENMAYCVGVNRIGSDANDHKYCGHSAVYDCLGESMVFSEEETILVTSLSKDHIEATRKKLRFLEDRDAFTLL